MNSKHTNNKNIININDTLFDFKLLKKEYNQEIKAEVFKFSHIKTGASLFAIKNNDPNKTFMVSFRTLPESSNGVAHVLEHTVLSACKLLTSQAKVQLVFPISNVCIPISTTSPSNTGALKSISDIYLVTINPVSNSSAAWIPPSSSIHLSN